MGGFGVLHSSPGLQACKPGFGLPGTGENIQASIRQPGQWISSREWLRTTPVHLRIQHGKGGSDIRKCLHYRFAAHKPMMAMVSDILAFMEKV